MILRDNKFIATALLSVVLSFFIFQKATRAEPINIEDLPEASTAPILLKRGNIALAKGDYDNALMRFEEALFLKPGYIEAYYRIGQIYISKEAYNKGIQYIKKSIALAPENLTLRHSLATLYESLENINAAIDEFRKLEMVAAQVADLMDDPTDAIRWKFIAHQKLATLLAQQGDMENSRAHIKKVLTLKHGGNIQPEKMDDNMIHLQLAELLKDEGKYDLALKAIQPILTSDKNNTTALLTTGTIYQQQQQYKKAEETFKTVLKINPEYALAHAHYGTLLVEKGDFPGALKHFESALNLDNNEAVTQRTRLVLPKIYIAYGNKLLQENDTRQALKYFEKAIAINPENSQIQYTIGLIYLSQNNAKKAAKHLEKTVKSQPDNIKAHYVLADVQTQLQEYEKASKSYRRVMELNLNELFDNEKIEKQLKMIGVKSWIASSDYDKAARSLLDIIATYPEDNAETHYYLAAIYAQHNYLDAALTEYQKVLDINPDNSRVKLNMAAIHHQQWNEFKAARIYGQLANNLSGGSTAKSAARRLDFLNKQINGFAYNLNQTLLADDNPFLSSERPFFDFRAKPTIDIRSDLSFNLTYNYKVTRKLKLALALSPSLTSYIDAGVDFFNSTNRATFTWGDHRNSLDIGYTQTDQSSLLDETRVSQTQNISATVRTRLETLPPLTTPDALKKVAPPQLLSLSLSLNDYISLSNPSLSAERYTAVTSYSTRFFDTWLLTPSYTLTINRNKNPDGDDYAYQKHAINTSLSKSFTSRWSGRLNHTLSFSLYNNPDSFSKREYRRKSIYSSLTATLNYSINSNMKLNAAYTLGINHANLPTGYILDIDNGPVGFQSSSLGSYRHQSLKLNFSLNF